MGFTATESDPRTKERKEVSIAEVVHYAPGDVPLCGLKDFPAPMTPHPELVRGCDDCLDLVAEDLKDHNDYMSRCLHCRQEIHAQGGVAVQEPMPPLREGRMVIPKGVEE